MASTFTIKTVEPSAAHTHTIINLHGRDSTAEEYCEEFFESEDSSGRTILEAFPHVKWVFPTAARIVSERFGSEMSQWFDMWTTNDPNERCNDQRTQLRESISEIAKIVSQEIAILGTAKNAVLCGISQGAVTAFATLLQIEEPLCAFVAFSTWMPGCVSLPESRLSNQTAPMFLAHCEDDEVIDFKYGAAFSEALIACGKSPEFHSYSTGGHWFNEPCGIDDLIEFLQRVMR